MKEGVVKHGYEAEERINYIILRVVSKRTERANAKKFNLENKMRALDYQPLLTISKNNGY